MINVLIIVFFSIFVSINASAFPLPKSEKAEFDIVRKNKIIGSHIIEFKKDENLLFVETTININVKVLFIPAYKFYHKSIETWKNNNFIKIEAHTDFEDEREYFIKGSDQEDSFIASGMDGYIELDKNILPSNFWNIEILEKKEIFDTQKGITREILVKSLGNEEIEINNKIINCKKFILNASSNPKDKGPFPEYSLWYTEDDELMKFQFKNWKDNKIVTIIRKK
tara:strand:- start:1717 stop:2391 length:675 start_codon:yes stop_codon:yes gene_type:complete